MLKISEIFTSIQGESSYSGLLCTFVRLSGCNLRCSYCDTKYAWQDGKDFTEENILKKIKESGISLVEITGGEPLMQESVIPFIKLLLDSNYNVLLETNGSLSIENIDKRVCIILDIKTPGSGMENRMFFPNLDLIKENHEVKFVVTDRFDYEWSKKIIEKYNLFERCNVLLSPAYGILNPAELIKWMIKDKSHARLNIQLHKYIKCR